MAGMYVNIQWTKFEQKSIVTFIAGITLSNLSKNEDPIRVSDLSVHILSTV